MPLTLIFSISVYNKNYTARNGRNENEKVEATTAFQQPPDEVPQPISQPFSCHFQGNWYREGEEFQMGANGCSSCICIDTEVKCNDDNCPKPTTTLRPTTTQIPTTTTTTTRRTTTTTPFPFVVGPGGDGGMCFKRVVCMLCSAVGG